MFTSLKRILKFGWQSFTRNKGLSSQVIFIIVIAVLAITSLLMFKDISSFLISQVQKKVDISVYFKKDIGEPQILNVKEELYKFSNKIESVNYISKEEAKKIFLERHKKDPLYVEALQQVGDNPFLPSLNIKAKNPTFYAKISDFLTKGSFGNMIEKVSYYQNKKVIDKLLSLTKNVKVIGIILSLILAFLIILITFNTVKLTIFARKEEIATMRLVGASGWFIKGPFVVQSIIYSVFAILISNLIIFSILFFLNSKLENLILDFNLLNYFERNFLFLLSCQISFAFLLGIFSSLISVRKYLKI